jgi:hypothetical protein
MPGSAGRCARSGWADSPAVACNGTLWLARHRIQVFSSSPWIRGAPQKKFSWLIRTISARISLSILGRPPRQWPREPDRQIAHKLETAPTQNGGRLDDDQTSLPICPPARQEQPEQPLTRAEAWTPRTCSLQHRELMAQGNKFQQQVPALAEPCPRSESLRRTHPVINSRYPIVSE